MATLPCVAINPTILIAELIFKLNYLIESGVNTRGSNSGSGYDGSISLSVSRITDAITISR